MSLQPAQTRPLERVASRRTVIRTAAWTAPAVSIAVAAPAYATISNPTPPSATLAVGVPEKYSVQKIKHVRWDITLNNTGSVPLTGLWAQFTFTESPGLQPTAFVASSTSSNLSGTQSWTTNTSTLVATYDVATVSPGEILQLHVDFTGFNNAAGKVKVEFFVTEPRASLGSREETWVSIGGA